MLSGLQTAWSRWASPAVERRGPVVVGVSVAAALGSVYVLQQVRGWWTLRCKRQHKREARKLAMEGLERHLQEAGMSKEKQEEICNLPLIDLRNKLQNGELKAVDVMHAYQMQALESDKTVNAITEVVYEAEVEAVKCDMTGDRGDRMLHGVPVSIKDVFPMEGYDCTLGFSRFIDNPWEEDCVIIKVLKHQGAIPFVRTNVPQTTICYDTCNPVYGQTLNPHDTKRSPGGSSGGEAALLADKASIIGIGGDIGGSIRIPSAFCGTYGLKPTAERISKKGCHTLFKGQNIVTSAYGPMGRDVDSLILVMKALLCPLHFELDKTIPPVPFREQIYEEKKLRIGFYMEDGYMITTPHMKRAVRVAVQALRSVGYEVVEWKFPNFGLRASALWSRAIFADGAHEVLQYLKYDVTDQAFGLMAFLLRICRWRFIHSFIHKLTQIFHPRLAANFKSLHGVRSVVEWQRYVVDVSSFRTEVEDDLAQKKLDVLIAPAFTMPAAPVGHHIYASGAASYTAAFNVLNFPAGSLPVTVANGEDTAKIAGYPTPDMWHRAIKKMCIGAEGLPLNVQVVALPWQEERCLRVMKDLETALQN